MEDGRREKKRQDERYQDQDSNEQSRVDVGIIIDKMHVCSPQELSKYQCQDQVIFEYEYEYENIIYQSKSGRF